MASCFYSISQYLIGNKQLAQQILIHAEEQSRRVLNIHPDPLLLTLLVKYCLNSIEFPNVNKANFDELMNLVPYQIPHSKFLLFISSWNDESSRNFFQWPLSSHIVISKTKSLFKKICRFSRLNYLFYKDGVHKNDDVDFLFSLLSLLKK